MRLLFMAARENGLDEHKQFWNEFVELIEDYIGIYEHRAPPHAVAASEWSADPLTVDKYFETRDMKKSEGKCPM
jgi:hypothetical protein